MNLTELFTLRGRSALITGGSRGIGRMIAEGFLSQGARVYITARHQDACDAAARELSVYGQCVSLPADVSTTDGIQDLVARYSKLEAGLDVLVNNAGAAWGEAFDTFPERGWDKVMDLNVKTPFFLTQALKPMLVRGPDQPPSKVINISSIDGISLNPLETYSYHASKAAMIQLTRRMAIRLVDDGIIVSGLAPGAFASEMNKAARDNADAVAAHIPAKRIGLPEDMAGAAVYLASRAGDYVVGSTLVVDGGVTHAR
jgi:NAD(P)-dependent dehydrogenase (short-subunit alcohol dehydrogenase family)